MQCDSFLFFIEEKFFDFLVGKKDEIGTEQLKESGDVIKGLL